MPKAIIRTEIRRWGNSLGLIIPKSISKDLNLEAGSNVEIVAEDGQLVVSVLASPSLTLESLLAGIPDDYQAEEIDWDSPQGKEIW